MTKQQRRLAVHESGEAGRRGPSLADEDEGQPLTLPLEPPQRLQFVTPERMSPGRAVLGPADVEDGGTELNLIPAKVAQFRRSKDPGKRSLSWWHPGRFVLASSTSAPTSPAVKCSRVRSSAFGIGTTVRFIRTAAQPA